ncbi:MAG: hypothetical protein ABIA37_00120 [Candidatus Woesearchaeota archaeon]
MKSKKAQSLSLTTIIVAALALIVLVVLVMIFTGRISVFKTGVEKSGEVELTALKISYGDCHPTTAKEASFIDSISKATSETDKETTRSILKADISACKSYLDETTCSGAGCTWK